MHPSEIFERVVALTEVSGVLAPGLVRRSLLDGRVDPAVARPSHYLDALPRIRARLKAYVPEDEAERRAATMELFLRGLPPSRPPGAQMDLDAFTDDAFELTAQGRRYTADELREARAEREKSG